MKKALILTHAGFQDHEVIYPYHSLKENNFDVTIVANQLGRFYGILGCHMVGDVLTTDFNDSKNREKYLISNNPEINGENFGTLEKKILKEKSDPLNHNLNTTRRFDYIDNNSNQQ